MSRPIRSLLLSSCLLAVWLAAAPAFAGPRPPDVYVNNHRFRGLVVQEGRDLLVDLVAAAQAMKLSLERDAQGRLSVKGRVLSTARARGTVMVVPLRDLAAVAGARLMEQTQLGIIDVITFDPRERARAVSSLPDGPPPAIPGRRQSTIQADRIADAAYVEELYGTCAYHLRTSLGMRIDSPIIKKFVSLEEVQQEAHNRSVQGFTEFVPVAGGVRIFLWIPVGQRADRTTHVMTHELSHVWQQENRVQFGTSQLVEGFCEWAASTLLGELGFADEMRRMERNMAFDYSEGYRYVRNMARKIGPIATVEHFRKSAWRNDVDF